MEGMRSLAMESPSDPHAVVRQRITVEPSAEPDLFCIWPFLLVNDDDPPLRFNSQIERLHRRRDMFERDFRSSWPRRRSETATSRPGCRAGNERTNVCAWIGPRNSCPVWLARRRLDRPVADPGRRSERRTVCWKAVFGTPAASATAWRKPRGTPPPIRSRTSSPAIRRASAVLRRRLALMLAARHPLAIGRGLSGGRVQRVERDLSRAPVARSRLGRSLRAAAAASGGSGAPGRHLRLVARRLAAARTHAFFFPRPTGVAGLTRQVENWLSLLHSFSRDHVLSMSSTRPREALYRPLVVQVPPGCSRSHESGRVGRVPQSDAARLGRLDRMVRGGDRLRRGGCHLAVSPAASHRQRSARGRGRAGTGETRRATLRLSRFIAAWKRCWLVGDACREPRKLRRSSPSKRRNASLRPAATVR